MRETLKYMKAMNREEMIDDKSEKNGSQITSIPTTGYATESVWVRTCMGQTVQPAPAAA